MENNKQSLEQKLEFITQVIKEAKSQYEENGFIYMLWGILIAITSISQYILLINEYYSIHYYPFFIIPLGTIYTIYYYSRKEKMKHNIITRIVSYTWLFISLNLIVLGFLFAATLKVNLSPIMLIILSIGMILSGISIRSRLIIGSGIIINITGYILFKLDWIYHPLVVGIVSLITFVIPGILLMLKYKKSKKC